jgi:hypothetical protein
MLRGDELSFLTRQTLSVVARRFSWTLRFVDVGWTYLVIDANEMQQFRASRRT